MEHITGGLWWSLAGEHWKLNSKKVRHCETERSRCSTCAKKVETGLTGYIINNLEKLNHTPRTSIGHKGLSERTVNFWTADGRVLEKVKFLLLRLEVSNRKYHRSQECHREKPRMHKCF